MQNGRRKKILSKMESSMYLFTHIYNQRSTWNLGPIKSSMSILHSTDICMSPTAQGNQLSVSEPTWSSQHENEASSGRICPETLTSARTWELYFEGNKKVSLNIYPGLFPSHSPPLLHQSPSSIPTERISEIKWLEK